MGTSLILASTPVPAAEPPPELGQIDFSPGAEEWIEFGPPHARRRTAFHDYETLYAVPGLYERVFYERLEMRSTLEVARMYGAALDGLGRDPASERVLDFGAGNGTGAERLRDIGVGRIVGLDIEPAARAAALRDRPAVYDDYLVGDLGAWPPERLAALGENDFTAVIAFAAIGVGHVPAPTLELALSLLAPGGVFAFAVHPRLLPDSGDAIARESGFAAVLAGLAERSEQLARRTYVHRRTTSGAEDPAVALTGRIRPV